LLFAGIGSFIYFHTASISLEFEYQDRRLIFERHEASNWLTPTSL